MHASKRTEEFKMINDISKAIYWIIVAVIAMFVVSVLSSSPTLLMIVIGVGGLWYYINSEAKDEAKEEKEEVK